jgi:hypothetical protein
LAFDSALKPAEFIILPPLIASVWPAMDEVQALPEGGFKIAGLDSPAPGSVIGGAEVSAALPSVAEPACTTGNLPTIE